MDNNFYRYEIIRALIFKNELVSFHIVQNPTYSNQYKAEKIEQNHRATQRIIDELIAGGIV